jgi:hypothetical protein
LNSKKTRVVDPDPDSVTLWIRICIGNPDPDPKRIRNQGARKLRNLSEKMHFLVIFKKIVPLNRYKIALTTF